MKVLFTDLDGTCVHYDWPEFGQVASEPNERGLYPCTSLDGSQQALLMRLPPSTSGKLPAPPARHRRSSPDLLSTSPALPQVLRA